MIRGEDAPPDPRALLKEIAQKRLAIRSGLLELTFNPPETKEGFPAPLRHVRIEFEGEKRRFVERRRSLQVPWIQSGSWEGLDSSTDVKALVKLLGSPEEVVRLGLGPLTEIRGYSIYDGTKLLRSYDTPSIQLWAFPPARISEPNQAKESENFDPRILGIAGSLLHAQTLERLLTPLPEQTVTVVGREMVNNLPNWHVLVAGPADIKRDFWIESAPTHRLMKTKFRSKFDGSETISEYDPAAKVKIFPNKVTWTKLDAAGVPQSTQVIEVKSAEFDLPEIHRRNWTLDGLNMRSGTEVRDETLGKRVGYWDGKELLPHRMPVFSSKGQRFFEMGFGTQPVLLNKVARRTPASPLGFDAMMAIVGIDRDSAEAAEAIKLLTEHHARTLGAGFRLRARESLPEQFEPLFRAVLARNPNHNDQGYACYGLATLLKQRSERLGLTKLGNSAAAESEQLFERVVKSYGDVYGFNLALLQQDAKDNLRELRARGIGKVAPEIKGDNLDGKPLSLHAFRGKVVVITFWSSNNPTCIQAIPRELKLVARMKDRPFAMIGVNIDSERKKGQDAAAKYGITWPSLWQGRGEHSTITDWGNLAAGSTFILDAKGIIRFKKSSTDDAIDRAVEALVQEAERK